MKFTDYMIAEAKSQYRVEYEGLVSAYKEAGKKMKEIDKVIKTLKGPDIGSIESDIPELENAVEELLEIIERSLQVQTVGVRDAANAVIDGDADDF